MEPVVSAPGEGQVPSGSGVRKLIGRSERLIALKVSAPTPGMLKTVSVRIALPASSTATSRPSSVTIGVIALRKTCLAITRLSGRPIARGVRM